MRNPRSSPGKYDAAAISFQSLLVNYPHSSYQDDALYGLAGALMRKASYAEAAVQLKKLIAVFPESALKEQAYFRLGLCVFRSGDAAKAMGIFSDIASGAAGTPASIAASAGDRSLSALPK